MPTGYTAAFSDRDVPFREFALQCARAFGACIMQRDDNPNDPPKHREVSAFYQESVDRDTQAIERFLVLSESEQWAEMNAAAERGRASRIKAQGERRLLRTRYEAALAKAQAWVAPTPEHENYRKFMIDQLTQSIEWDCPEREYNDPSKVTVVSPTDHRASLKRNLDYSIKSRDEERERCAQANAWIDALYASLPEA